MYSKRCKCAVLCLLFVFGMLLPAAAAQEPIFLVKIRDVERMFRDVETLVPAQSPIRAQVSVFRALLGGTGWLDPQRPVVAGVFEAGPGQTMVAMIPFRAPNANFQAVFNPVAREGYYLLTLPPQAGPGLAADPVVEQALVRASGVQPPANLVLEVSAAALLARMEPQIGAALKQLEGAKPAAPKPASGPEIPPDEMRAIMGDLLSMLGQAETLRFGMDISGDMLSLLLDVDARPDAALARLFVDPGGETRLMDFAADMPLRFRSRAPEMSGMMELAELAYGRLYRQLGFDTGELSALAEAFTGEMAGGMRIDADGFAVSGIYVLRPGVDGDEYIEKSYFPFLDRYTGRAAELAAANNQAPAGALYERTPDSTVAGLRVAGLKMNSLAMFPPGERPDNPLVKLPIEVRLAASGDLLFFASTDAGIAELAARSANLPRVPAGGPTSSLDIDLGALFAGIRTLAPASAGAGALPGLSGKMTVEVDMRDGRMQSRTRFNIGELTRMMEKVNAASKGQNTQGTL